MDVAKQGESEKRIEEALKSPTALEITEQPLGDVVEYLKDKHNIQIQLDEEALRKTGITRDTPVTKSIKGVSLRSALRLLLRDLGLTYVIKDDALWVTTPEKADEILVTRAYPVADLVVPFQSMLGMRSLKIELNQEPAGVDRVIGFRSLGLGPRLDVTLVRRPQLAALGWGLGLLVFLVGAAMTNRPAGRKVAYIVFVALLATLVPLLVEDIAATQVGNMVFWAALWLAVYYVLVRLVRCHVAFTCRRCPGLPRPCGPKAPGPQRPVTPLKPPASPGGAGTASGTPAGSTGLASGTPAVVAVLAAILSLGMSAMPQAAAADEQEPAKPVSVPDDALIVPYDPDWKVPTADADKLLVPYEKFVELWNLAHPDKRIESKSPPAAFGLAGAEYKTALVGDDALRLTGQLEIDVFVDGFLDVPLRLGGGVLSLAELDGKPARLSVVAKKAAIGDRAWQKAAIGDRGPSAPPSVEATSKSARPAVAALSKSGQSPTLVLLHLSGKGRHKLRLEVRLKLIRQGGWRGAFGVLPAAPATAVEIAVPEKRTDVRLGQLADRRSYRSEKPDETIRTILGVDGALAVQWRPEVAEGQVDHALTAVSNALFDVQEDGLRLTWRLALEFPRARREQFRLALPAGYLLEKVQGDNVRGWNVVKTGQGESLDIALLRPAKDREELTLRLWRAGGWRWLSEPQTDGTLAKPVDTTRHWRSQWHTGRRKGTVPVSLTRKRGQPPRHSSTCRPSAYPRPSCIPEG